VGERSERASFGYRVVANEGSGPAAAIVKAAAREVRSSARRDVGDRRLGRRMRERDQLLEVPSRSTP
jgi:hypothetical protein